MTIPSPQVAPLREQVRDALRASILEFTLQPGQHLVERQLMDALGVSRPTVREAIRELASEGLVDVVPQRGAFVASVSPMDASDLFDARAALGRLLIELFIARAEPAARMALSDAVASFADAAESPLAHTAEVMAAYDAFMAALYRGAAALAIEQLMESILSRTRLLRVQAMDAGGHGATAADLRSVLAAILAREPGRAADAFTRQIARAKLNALSSLHRA